MLTSLVVSIVRTCTRFATLIVIVSLLLAIGAGFYAARNFSINTDINTLISPDLDWRKRDNQFEKAFDREKLILAVVEGPTPELTSAAGKALAEKLAGDTKNFESVQPLGSGEFFEKNGLLFLPVEEVGKVAGQLEAAAPLIEIMAGDPSIRGLTGALETGLAGIKRGQVKLDNTERPFNLISQTVENILSKGTATFSWRELVSDKPLGRFRQARLHRIQAEGRLQRARARQGSHRRDPAGGQGTEFRRRVWRARAADRTDSDRQ